MKNRQFNFLPFGVNPFVGATARPNELTYSEDWAASRLPADGRHPDNPPPPTCGQSSAVAGRGPLPTNPDAGLSGMMTPPGGGS